MASEAVRLLEGAMSATVDSEKASLLAQATELLTTRGKHLVPHYAQQVVDCGLGGASATTMVILKFAEATVKTHPKLVLPLLVPRLVFFLDGASVSLSCFLHSSQLLHTDTVLFYRTRLCDVC